MADTLNFFAEGDGEEGAEGGPTVIDANAEPLD
jgi:hypothetical protein